MSNEAEQFATDIASEQAISEYLRENPDFFERHGDLLSRLKIPHAASGNAVSLVERQVANLRERNAKLDTKLAELVRVAKLNNQLAERIHHLALDLLGSDSLETVLAVVERALREKFAAEQSVLLLFHEPENKAPLEDNQFSRGVARNDAGLAAFASFIKSDKSRCGQLRDSQREYLFGDYAEQVASAALIPLGREASMGLLAIGSKDPDHFNPAMGTEFLDRIGGLIHRAVACALKK